MVELRQLKHILLVNEFRSFSKAAEMAHISQPSLSISIKKAEEYFGSKLFLRKWNNIELTKQGEIVVEMAKRMFEIYTEGSLRLSEINSLKSRTIKFGIDSFLARSVVNGFLPKMYEKYPENRFEVNIDPWYKLIEALKRKELDFIIVVFSNKSDFPDKYFSKKEMFVPMAGYFTRKDHPLANLKNFDSRRLNEFQWVGNIVSPTWAKWALKATDVTEEKMKDMFLAKVNDYDKTIDLVQKNDAVGGHVYDELIPYEKSGKIKILDLDWFVPHPKNIGIIVSLKSKKYSPACKRLIEEIQEYSKKWKE